MTPTSEAEGSEDVNDFLQRIRELGEKRDKEDAERTKKLEEEILQGRKERQARRAERARSISPTKDSSPLLDPLRLSMSSLSHRAIDPPEQLDPTPRTPAHDTHSPSNSFRDETVASGENSPAGSRPEGSDMGTSPKASPTLRSRAGTLSWQQRPTSRDLSGNRSFFSTSPSRETRWRAMSNASTDEHGVLQSPLASLPASRESSSLRQAGEDGARTQEKQLEESKVEPADVTKVKGHETEKGTEPEKENSQSTVDERSPPPSRASSSFADSSLGNRYSSISSVSAATGLGSPLPLSSAQKFEPPKLDGGSESQTTSPPSPRRLAPERSTSPTKGLGGFVQSAMLRRSDSISKRWSAQIPSGHSRGNSLASNRNSFAAPSNVDIFSTPKLSREGSSLSPHRPTSIHSEATVVQQAKDGERPATPPAPARSEVASRPPLALHARSSSTVGVESPIDSSSRPTTPVSRTMDPKRWSPTKSTWLESALNLPESPRHKRQPSQQAPWAKDRQSRGSVDLGRRNSFKQVNPVGLLRTAPLGSHVKKPSLSVIPNVLNTQDSSPTKEEPPTDPSPAEEEPLSDYSPAREELTTYSKRLSSEATLTAEATGIEAPTEESETAKERSDDTTTRKQAPSPLAPTPKVNTNVTLPSPREHIRDPLLNRPKPQSPVVDFRANLRKREVAKDESDKAEPEFKNVFGRLRKAETSNYVAPDKLKDNILKGKAALNATGGPKKTQRVDEFRESILKQKDTMKMNGGSVRRSTVGQSDAPTEAVPEAILKRQRLSKQSSDMTGFSIGALPSPTKETEALGRPHSRHLSSDPFKDNEHTATPQPTEGPAGVLESSSSPSKEEFTLKTLINEKTDDETEQHCMEEEPIRDSNSHSKENSDPSAFDTGTNSEIARQHAEEAPEKVDEDEGQKEPVVETIKSVRALPSGDTTQAASALPIKEGTFTKGRLAGRINPALAGLLSRGPPVAVDGSKTTLSGDSSAESTLNPQSSTSAPTLTHMTKARARGPKRRPPKAVTADASFGVRDPSISPKTTPSSFDVDTPGTSFSPIEPPLNTSGGWPLPEQGSESKVVLELDYFQSSPPTTSVPHNYRDSLPPVPEKDTKPVPSTPSRRPLTLERRIYEMENQERSPSNKSAITPHPATSPSSTYGSQTRGSLPHHSSPSLSPLRSSFRENQPYPSPRMIGPHAMLARSRDSSPFRKSLPSPPVPPKGSSVSTDQLSSSSRRSSVSLVPQADESLEAISNFFRTCPRSSDRVNIDPQLILADKIDNFSIRTLRKQIWEITGDGRKQDLPVNQEYILYEGAMYLCVHLFEDDGNARTEVQLWCGDDVWGGAVDNALPFSRKIARENSCKLEIVGQGKEPARFIQALGGILITRRGSSSRSSSSAIFMLCGRKHLGQMVFDEVDFSPHNLCTGYPFVISAMFGKVYLWKGKGSSAEEIGAARLIGMDLGLTGEFEEVAEGEEPGSFHEVFPQYKETGEYLGSDHWLLKPAHEYFRLRLLRVDHELGQRSFWIRRPGSSSPVIRPNDTVQEVEPFSQKDLSPKGIYILDTFFEIYVIVGDQASNRPAEFASAVVFAHEYGILAASVQDRPFIPKSFISLGGAPEYCRSVFRKWSRRPLQRPPQVFPLNAAIDAIRS